MLKMTKPRIVEVFFAWYEGGVLRKIGDLALAILVGLLIGSLLVFSSGLSSSWQAAILIIPIALAFVMIFQNLERLILAAIAIGIPLNIDVSLIISPYARNPVNLAQGNRTLIALTELRISLILVLLVFGYALWLVRLKSTESKPVHFFWGITLPALGLIFFEICSVFFAQDQQLSLFRIEQLVEVFLAFFYIANHIKTSADMQFFVLVSLGALLMESALMSFQWVTGWTFQFAGIDSSLAEPGRISGTMGNSGPAAGYLSGMLLIACAALGGFQKKSYRVLAAVSFLLGVVALTSTGSRIGWIAAGVTLPAFVLIGLWLGWIKREFIPIVFVGVLAFGLLFGPGIYTRFTAADNGSADARPMMWNLALKIISANPWLGVGSGNYALATKEYYSTDIGRANEVIDIQVHDAFLNVWGESGIFALLAYLGVLGAAFMKAWACIKSPSSFISLMGVGVSLGIVSMCIQMVTGTFHMRAITIFLWFIIALAASLRNLRDQGDAELERQS